MQSKPIIGVILAFGVAFSILAGSGIGAAVFGESPGDSETTRVIEQVGEDASVSEDGGGLDADVAGDDEPTLVGLAISGGQFAVQLVAAVAVIPATLIGLGFPAYFAVPVGSIAQIIAFIGLIQFVRGTEFI